MIIARILLGFILIIQKNQELVNTIKNILKIFPEGIIIESIDEESKKSLVQFVNDAAVNDIINYENPIGKPIIDERLDYFLKEVSDYKESECFIDQGHVETRMTLSELLQKHLNRVKYGENIISSNIEINQMSSTNPQNKFFNVKSMKVKWGSFKNSFIHMFVNTTYIK